MKLVTLNAGLLSLSLPGGMKKVEPAAWVEERLACMPEWLAALDADVLLLQEVYSQAHKRFLAEALAASLPHAAFSRRDARWRLLPDSLMVLSRHPVQSWGFERFQAGRWDERLLDTKGFLHARLATPEGTVFVINAHTTAGLFMHPEHCVIDAVRAAQIEQLIAFAQAHAGAARTVLAGDFNCGPGVPADAAPLTDLHLPGHRISATARVSVGNYRLPMARGYADTHVLLALPEAPTWSPTANPLNRGGDHASRGCPAQRIDHVFVKPGEWQAEAGGIILQDAVVPLPGGAPPVPLSDHYGYWVSLTPR